MSDAIRSEDLDETDVLDAPIAASTRDIPQRYSAFKLMKQSPLHVRHAMLFGGEQTLCRRLGTGTHAILLEDKELRISSGLTSDGVAACISAIRSGADVRQYPGSVRRGKEWDKFLAANENATIVLQKDYEQAKSIVDLEASGVVLVTKEQYDRAHAMANAIRECDAARRVLLAPDAVREQRIDWTWNGRAWRSTPDARGFRFLGELKTTRCADPALFWRDALKLSYHVQAAIYQRAIEAATGVRPRECYLFAVESVAPYAVTPFRFSERSLDHGHMLAEKWHARFLECEAREVWPGYSTRIEDLDVYDPEDETELDATRAMANDDGRRAVGDF